MPYIGGIRTSCAVFYDYFFVDYETTRRSFDILRLVLSRFVSNFAAPSVSLLRSTPDLQNPIHGAVQLGPPDALAALRYRSARHGRAHGACRTYTRPRHFAVSQRSPRGTQITNERAVLRTPYLAVLEGTYMCVSIWLHKNK